MKIYSEIVLLNNLRCGYGDDDWWTLDSFGSDEGYDPKKTSYPYPKTKQNFQRLLQEKSWEKVCEMQDGSEVWAKV